MAAAVAVAVGAEGLGYSSALISEYIGAMFAGGAAGATGAGAIGVAGATATVVGGILLLPSSSVQNLVRGKDKDAIAHSVDLVAKAMADPTLRDDPNMKRYLAPYAAQQNDILSLTKQIEAGVASNPAFLDTPEGIKLNASRANAWGRIADKVAGLGQEDQFLLQNHLEEGLKQAQLKAENASKPKVEFKSWDQPAGTPTATKPITSAKPLPVMIPDTPPDVATSTTQHADVPVESPPAPTNVVPRTATVTPSVTSPREHDNTPVSDKPAVAPIAPLKVSIPSGTSASGLANPSTITPSAALGAASAGPTVTVPRTSEGDALTAPHAVPFEAPTIPPAETPTETTSAHKGALPLMVPDAPPDSAEVDAKGNITAGSHGANVTRAAPPPAATAPSEADIAPGEPELSVGSHAVPFSPSAVKPVSPSVAATSKTITRDNVGADKKAGGRSDVPPASPPADVPVPKAGAHAGANAVPDTGSHTGAVPQTHEVPQVATKPPPSKPEPSMPQTVPTKATPHTGASGDHHSINFDFDSTQLDADAVTKIKEEAAEIKKNGFQQGQHIRVEGDTDAVGSDRYNVALSRRRAESVATRLKTELHNQGIDVKDSQIDIVAAGKSHLVEKTDGQSRANRRAMIEVTKP